MKDNNILHLWHSGAIQMNFILIPCLHISKILNLRESPISMVNVKFTCITRGLSPTNEWLTAPISCHFHWMSFLPLEKLKLPTFYLKLKQFCTLGVLNNLELKWSAVQKAWNLLYTPLFICNKLQTYLMTVNSRKENKTIKSRPKTCNSFWGSTIPLGYSPNQIDTKESFGMKITHEFVNICSL